MRVRLCRKKGWRMPANTVKVDRTTKWGNPFRIGEQHLHPIRREMILIADKQTAVDAFKDYLRSDAGRTIAQDASRELRGKNLACWCKEGQQCHADALLAVANQSPTPSKE
ncbi:MAG: DUF4326 domain-containing protein [Tepidisphaeraceae bacterium]